MKDSALEERWGLWMRAAMDGDAQAYHDFLASVTPRLRTMARRGCGRYGILPGEAEDVVQEVLIAIHLKRGTWDARRPIGPWLSAIMRNKLIDSLRRRGKQVRVPIEDVTPWLEAPEQSDPTEALDIERMLRTLKDPQQDIVRSISVNGAGVRETARRLNMSEGAVRVTLHRALKALSNLYRSNGREDE